MKGRQRGRNGGKPRMHHQGGGGGGRNGNFDHNAGRMRGNAQQLLDKFLALGRDASSQGDRVLAENYFQHADHYYRVVNARFEGQQNQNPNHNQHRRFNGPNQGGYEGQDGQDGQDGQGNYNQGNYNDFNRQDMQPGPSQNLIPSGNVGMDQTQASQQNHQPPQQSFDNGYQPQAQQSAREPDGDIGLPPQLFGGQPQRQDDTPAAEPQGNPNQGGNENRGFRPRHGGRRRFGGRRDGQPNQPNQSEPTGEPT